MRFTPKKWVFNAAALRRERRAVSAIGGAYDFIFQTATLENGIDLDGDSFAALVLLDRLRKLVCLEFVAANRAAKRLDLNDRGVL